MTALHGAPFPTPPRPRPTSTALGLPPPSPPLSSLLVPRLRRAGPACMRPPSLGSASAMQPMPWPTRSSKQNSFSASLPHPTLEPHPPDRPDPACLTPRSSGMIRPIFSWCSFTTRFGVSRTFGSWSRSSSSLSRLPTSTGRTGPPQPPLLHHRRPRPHQCLGCVSTPSWLRLDIIVLS